MSIEIEIYKKLDEKLKEIDKSIVNDAFSFLLDLPEQVQADLNEKFIVTPWRYIFLKTENAYVGRIVLDKRDIELCKARISAVGINGLAVKKEYQKLGLGSKLLKKAIELCKVENIDSIFLNAGEELHDYYKRFGFEMKPYKFHGRSGKTYLEEDGMVLVINKDYKDILLNNDIDIGRGNV